MEAVGLNSKPAILSSTQPELHLDLTISEPGNHILVINYITDPDTNSSTSVLLSVESGEVPQIGQAALHPCPYTTACRQVVIDQQRKVLPFNLPGNYVKLVLKVELLFSTLFYFLNDYDWTRVQILNFAFHSRPRDKQMQQLTV